MGYYGTPRAIMMIDTFEMYCCDCLFKMYEEHNVIFGKELWYLSMSFNSGVLWNEDENDYEVNRNVIEHCINSGVGLEINGDSAYKVLCEGQRGQQTILDACICNRCLERLNKRCVDY